MPRAILSERAKADVRSISRYIAKNNWSAAARWLEEFDRKLNLLASQPLIGESVERLRKDLRRHSYGNYLVFYVPVNGGIEVRRVLHAARRIEDLF